jgi:hypothetical protein
MGGEQHTKYSLFIADANRIYTEKVSGIKVSLSERTAAPILLLGYCRQKRRAVDLSCNLSLFTSNFIQ